MVGSGVEQRIGILRRVAEQQILKPLQTHNWSTQIVEEREFGEYIVVSAERNQARKKVALLYSSATDNQHYKALDNRVDRIFVNGELYMTESFAYGITTPIASVDDFFATLVRWNKELEPVAIQPSPKTNIQRKRKFITAENPLDAIWMRLKQFSSIQTTEKLIRRRAEAEGITLEDSTIASKASGVAFTVRNACDYLRKSDSSGLNNRILSLYYGNLALASAEMLSAPNGPSDLDEVEGFTKRGHGLYTVSGGGDIGSIVIGPLATGFFPRWVSFLGHDINHFLKRRPKSESDVEKMDSSVVITMLELFGAIPELNDLYREVSDTFPLWVAPHYDMQLNRASLSLRSTQRPKIHSSYIHFTEPSGEMPSEILRSSPWPLAEIEEVQSELEDHGKAFRARLDHPGFDHWFEALPIHHSPFSPSSSLIFPQYGAASEYRVIAFSLIYALSIVVRYMPSTWRRVEGGDCDQYLPLVEMALNVFERVLPQEFLQTISGESIHVKQPGTL